MNFPTSDRILSEIEVLKVTTFSRFLLRTAIENDNFPRSLVISERRRGWRASDVEAWIANLKETESADTGVDKSVEPVESSAGAGEIK